MDYTPPMKLPMHTFKMESEPWDRFLTKAQARGRTGAAIIRAAVLMYLDEDDANADALDEATDEYGTNVEPGRPKIAPEEADSDAE